MRRLKREKKRMKVGEETRSDAGQKLCAQYVHYRQYSVVSYSATQFTSAHCTHSF